MHETQPLFCCIFILVFFSSLILSTVFCCIHVTHRHLFLAQILHFGVKTFAKM